ncbi:hypothetical protein CYMTET_8835 [Cymbomonas tetramitiformis]|uniref:Uncharacterized protein n=1 Tax=Cymbomonas tetramitiformis TaxID=36881 RepID=A0AAE0GSQ1_9CHLO|nr:hypothetical protein CYMTET_8835 [Cymbomonas tetramitiformis]
MASITTLLCIVLFAHSIPQTCVAQVVAPSDLTPLSLPKTLEDLNVTDKEHPAAAHAMTTESAMTEESESAIDATQSVAAASGVTSVPKYSPDLSPLVVSDEQAEIMQELLQQGIGDVGADADSTSSIIYTVRSPSGLNVNLNPDQVEVLMELMADMEGAAPPAMATMLQNPSTAAVAADDDTEEINATTTTVRPIIR